MPGEAGVCAQCDVSGSSTISSVPATVRSDLRRKRMSSAAEGMKLAGMANLLRLATTGTDVGCV